MGKVCRGRSRTPRECSQKPTRRSAFPLSKLCFEGPDEALQLTENTQPALLAVSIAACRVLRSKGLLPDYVAGHSLGEYSALVAAGSLDFADAVRLVRKRGQYMQDAVPPGVGAMAALLKLPDGKLDGMLADGRAGRSSDRGEPQFARPDRDRRPRGRRAIAPCELAKAAGAHRAILLPVSAPFHCPLMRPAQERLEVDLDATEFRDLAMPLVNNWQARDDPHRRGSSRGSVPAGAEPRALDRIHPQLLAANGVTRFVEVGAGGVLTGLLRNIDP